MYLLIVAAFMFSGSRTKPSENADTVLILGAKVNGTPAVPSLVLQERLDAAVAYLNEYPKAKVIVSGGQGLMKVRLKLPLWKNIWLMKELQESGLKRKRNLREQKRILNIVMRNLI